MSDTEIAIPALLAHQQPVARHPARFKLLRFGRRWGKDRLAFNISWFGHGPDHCWPGIVDGWDVAWLAPDYPQAKIIWNEEIRPRFQGKPGITLNQQEHSVKLGDYGQLVLFSSENVDSIRGLGKRLIGVIVNEAAHLDLAYAWRRVIRPAIADNEGWVAFMSTTNRGWDGGTDEDGHKQIPSYFNQLCQEVRDGKRAEEWAEFTGDARQNPKIKPAEFDAMAAEYPMDSVALQEEVYAKLLKPGTGIAFPEWRDEHHCPAEVTIPDWWEFGAGYDWGYWDPSAFVLVAQNTDGDVVVVKDERWQQRLGYDMGTEIAAMCQDRGQVPAYIAADASIWGVQGQKGWPNLAEEVQAGINDRWQGSTLPPQLVAVPKGKDSRIARTQLLHHYLAWKTFEDGTIRRPRLTFGPEAAHCRSTIPTLPPSPLNAEDVDTDADDHHYDALTYYLMTRPRPAEEPKAPYDVDRHPGLDDKYPWLKQRMDGREPKSTRPRFRPAGR